MSEFLDHVEQLLSQFHNTNGDTSADFEARVRALINDVIAPLQTTITGLQSDNTALSNQVGELQTAVIDTASHLAAGNVATATEINTAAVAAIAPKEEAA